MNSDSYSDHLDQATKAILEAVAAAIRYDDRLAGRTRTEILAALTAAASYVANPMAGNDPMPFGAELEFTRGARILAHSGSTLVAVFLARLAQALLEPGDAQPSPGT